MTVSLDDDDFDATLAIEDLDDTRRTGPGRKPKPASSLLALALLEATLTRRDIRRLSSEPAFCLVIQAPAADWVGPLVRAVKLFGDWDFYEQKAVSERRYPKDAETANEQAAEALSGGKRIFGVSPTPRELLPAAMIAAADMTVTVPLPSNDVIATVIRQVTGSSPRHMPDNIASGLGYGDIVSSIRLNSTAQRCVDRLIRAGSSGSPNAVDIGGVPEIADLHGYGAAKCWAENLIVDLAAWRAGEIDFSVIDRQAVLVSEPGLGKTTLMRSLARSARLPLIATSVGAWFANGPGALDSVIKQIDQVFASARAVAPAILFLDEIDAVPNRATLTPRGADWWIPVITHLLTTLDGAVSGATDRLIVVGATNHPERVDAAMIREGRLSKFIVIDRPDEAALEGILHQHLGSDLQGADLRTVAAMGLGASGADVTGWVRTARRLARHAGRAVEIGDLTTAVAPPDHRPPGIVRRIAVHEAGHAVLGHRLGVGTVRGLSIIPKGDGSEGHTKIRYRDDTITRADIEAKVMYLLGGRAAEDVVLGSVGGGSGGAEGSDLDAATRALGMVHLSFGLGERLIFASPPRKIVRSLARNRVASAWVEADLQRLYGQAVGIALEHALLIRAVADELVARRYVGEARFREIADSFANRPRRTVMLTAARKG